MKGEVFRLIKKVVSKSHQVGSSRHSKGSQGRFFNILRGSSLDELRGDIRVTAHLNTCKTILKVYLFGPLQYLHNHHCQHR